MWRLVVRPKVEDDLVEASLWYDKKQIGLGDQFLAEYVAAIYRILENPWLFSIAAIGPKPITTVLDVERDLESLQDKAHARHKSL